MFKLLTTKKDAQKNPIENITWFFHHPKNSCKTKSASTVSLMCIKGQS